MNEDRHAVSTRYRVLKKALRIAFALGIVVGVTSAATPAHAQECLTVTVVDATGAVVPNAVVTIGAMETSTDQRGVATFCGLGNGPHTIVASAPGLRAEVLTVDDSTGDVSITLAFGVASEQVVVVGSRTEGRAVLESVVPVDVITSTAFAEQGDPDMVNQLRNTTPSFNVSTNPISDAGTIVRPASLRNLAPDHTLVLVNGKRRHRAAVIHWISIGPTDGAQGADLAAIPSIAVQRVEVLRDGASAQYGSDAIAGVLNYELKRAASGGSMQVSSGGFGAGDGENVTFAGNIGLPLGTGALGSEGFANLSFEYGNSSPTDRAVQRNDALQLIANGNGAVRTPTAQVWGQPRIDDDIKFFGNFGKNLGGLTELYGHTNYASKRVDGGFYFRNPHTRAAVYGRGSELLVGDLLDAEDGILDGSAGCPSVRHSAGRIVDQDAFDAVLANPNCFTFHQPFAGAAGGRPGGFTPQFGAEARDASVVGGIRGAVGSRLFWDASAGIGSNLADFFIYNTVNASLGPDSPTSFDPGLYRQTDTTFNYDLRFAASEMVHLAAGLEWRNERFEVGGGEPPSWQFGSLAPQGFSAASNGFPGFSPIAAGNWNRSNYAAYGDLEIGRAGGPYTLALALRGERFSDFGSTVNHKVAGRVEASDWLAVRGSTSTGFRAPTPGQQNAFNVSTIFDVNRGDLINVGTIPSTSAVARLVGGGPLQPETSRNYTAGAIFDHGPFSVATDYFRINLADRLWFSRDYELQPEQVEGLVAEGITSAANLGVFRFFTNQIGTASQGLDIVATYAPEALGANTVFSFLLNHTRTTVTERNPEIVSDELVHLMENAFPETRWNLSARHQEGRLRLLARLSYWGDFFDREDLDNYPGEYLVDLEASYELTPMTSISIGAQNAFNNYPGFNLNAAQESGNLYPQSTPFGFNGGYYYMRLNYRWGSSF